MSGTQNIESNEEHTSRAASASSGRGTWPWKSAPGRSKAARSRCVKQRRCQARDLTNTLGGGATVGKFGAAPVGETVILAALCERRAGRRPVLRCAGRQGHRRHH